MTKQEIVNKLNSDPYYVASFVIQNNPDGVYDQLNSMGLAGTITTIEPECIYPVVENLINSKQGEKAVQALNVPYLPENDPGGYNDLFQEFGALDGGNNIVVPQSRMMGTGQESSGDGSFWPQDLGQATGIVTSLLDSFLPYFQGGKGTGVNQAYQQPAQPESNKPNLILWGGVIAFVVVILLIVKML
jgi:hypothetical protein